MAVNKWLGVAQPRVAQKAFQPSNVSPGSVWLLRVGGSNYQYIYSPSIVGSELTDQERAKVVTDGLAEAYTGGGFGGGGNQQTIASLASALVGGKWSLLVEGNSSGAPIDVEVSAEESSQSIVKTVELQTGRAAQNEQQTIRWPKTPTAGNSLWRYKNAITAAVAYNASSATLQTALEGLSSIGSGNVSVSGSHTAGYVVEFIGSLAGAAAEPLIVYSTDSEGTSPVTYEVTTRGGLSRTVYAMGALDNDSETVLQFTFDGETSHFFTGASSAETILLALESIPGIGSGNAGVNQLADRTWEIALAGKFIGTEVPELTLDAPDGTAPELTATDGTTEKAQTVVRITIENLPSLAAGGVSFGYNATNTTSLTLSVATVAQDVTDHLSGFGIPWSCSLLENVEGMPVVIELTAAVTTDAYDAGLVTVLGHTLEGTYAFDVRVTQKAQTARNSLQQITLHSDPDGGTFTLTYGANTTAGLAYNASAATVEAALEGLASIGSGNVTVDGNDGGPYVVTFTGSLAATAATLISGSGASLTITDSAAIAEVEIQSATGPNWWTNAGNWSLSSVPASTDTVVFESGSVNCSYGISGVAAIGGLDIYRTFTGQIGLPEVREDGSVEKLTQYLSLSDSGSKIAIRIGLGDDGEGPSVVRIDTSAQEADVSILYSSQAAAESLYTIGLAGDLATVQVNGASVIFSGATGLTTTIDTLRFSPTSSNSDGGDAVVEWGADCTVTYVETTGGVLRAGSVPHTLVVNGGQPSVRGTGNLNQLNLRNATLRYSATGQVGKQGPCTSLTTDVDDQITITSAAHGLASGDLVFVRGIFGFPDRYYPVSVLTADTFTLVGSDGTYIAGGSLDESFFDDFFGGGTVPSGSSDGAKWGLADAIRIGSDSTLDFSLLGVERTVVAPIILQSETAVIFDPLITVADLRWQCLPGFLDQNFGGQGVYKREQTIAVSYNSGSYAAGGGGVVGG